MLNTPEKLEKYNKIIEADRFIKNKNSKYFYYQKLLENNSKIKNDNIKSFKPIATEIKYPSYIESPGLPQQVNDIELDPNVANLKKAMKTQQRQPETKVDNPNKSYFLTDPTRPLVTAINPNANPSNVLSHLNSAINPIQWGKNIVESVKTVINPNTYVNLAKVAIGEQGGDKMKALNDALTIGEGVLGKKGLRLAKKGYVDNTDININLNKIRKEGEKLGLSDWEIKRQQLDKVGITESQREAYVPGVSELIEKNVFPENYDLNNLNPFLTKKRKEYERLNNSDDRFIKNRFDAFRTYLGLPQQNNTFKMSPFTPNRGFHGKITEDVYTIKPSNSIFTTEVKNDIQYKKDPYFKQFVDKDSFDKVYSSVLDPISGNTNMTIHKPWKEGQIIGGASSSDRWDLDLPLPIKIGGKRLTLPIHKLIGKPFYTAYSYNAGQGGLYKNLDDINKVD